MEQANHEQDASLQALRDALDAVPDRTAARVMEALGPRMNRAESDIQTVFGLIKSHSDQITSLSTTVAALSGRGAGASWVVQVGVPIVIALLSAAVAAGGVIALVK